MCLELAVPVLGALLAGGVYAIGVIIAWRGGAESARRAHEPVIDQNRTLKLHCEGYERQIRHNREHDRLAAAEWVVFSEALAALNDAYDAMEAPDVS